MAIINPHTQETQLLSDIKKFKNYTKAHHSQISKNQWIRENLENFHRIYYIDSKKNKYDRRLLVRIDVSNNTLEKHL